MKFILYNLATAKEPWADEVSELYKKKISFFIPFDIQSLKAKKSAREDADFKRNEESELILKNINSDDYVVLFDERGSVLDSIQFSKKVENILGSSKKRAIFIIGGAFGVNEEVRKRADLKVALSPMVMNHLMAQAMSLEQIYRAFTIIKKIPYHNI
ncbi:23S rRNA (pseudouridine(1915)-N(3))-methyltransferase RlmH [Bdellovibrio bacteriovorus]|uniref:Ribosomal RNA large subunit methyltransferase H n=1 Tax=Bdellovibrio bacteriovorus (strain ATCC 15356 / DSM 50701 / NCIMB 9529 / HD100) TaxID=264462 RepID=RLMH_BDEBA|nr:23S rRNA (pseudouridine(1915)-N(3))-methyltransferase RlmH [Bdellovibrio bacteriovorus]Q6MGS7.1 RecName: Full=Ribosomal RNA large subunit methyltransferase H; AltName: Full=23S rRNA (pseudouridine1915-N3)-methyltransferase; AltName: Full=23S rRNA m3Psi1915 methyltransferase; AltName: Full=rRNA (pseudouridine-N3-)-methyltransferase RlmH [Bdellovibrio bacteriovorus HD100]AHZ85597.1 50S rRNA methyltransferase [Bdellovibrio bacteriovorus]BEV70143.1 Ribosomal RNA large subunit methyltransferase H 